MIFNESKYNSKWSTKTLDQLGTFDRGKSKHRPRNDKSLFVNGKYPFIQTGEIKEAILFVNKHTEMYNEFGLKQSKLWPKNTLCITIAANIAETALLGYPMCFPDSVVGFNAYPEESSEIFMHYVFTYIKKSIQNTAIGSIQDNINIDYLTKLSFKIPEKNYQDKICMILSTLDKKIELNNRINSELEAMAKTLYDYWFVQFDFPNAHGKPYKTSGGKMVWNEELKKEIPEGWYHSNILAVADLFGGGTPSKKREEYWGGEIPFFTPTDAGPDVFTLTTQDYITNQGLKNCSSPLFEEGTIFITARGSVGKLVIVANKMAMNQSCYALKAKRDISSSFLYYLSKDLIHHLQVKSSGSVFDSIVSNDIKNTYLAIPTDQVIRQFSKITEPIFNQILLNLKQNKVLSELRDWLLPMLMNGQVKVE